MGILKQKWYCLTLKVKARNESVIISIHDLPAVIASLGVGIYPKPQHEFLTLTCIDSITTQVVACGARTS
ncbi:MAG: hypothetical protein D6772_17570 [Bacteroidetes bacterium]|nr:MAG: hypothetical protein D6772_17570 [Bacteroidota bacterium]